MPDLRCQYLDPKAGEIGTVQMILQSSYPESGRLLAIAYAGRQVHATQAATQAATRVHARAVLLFTPYLIIALKNYMQGLLARS